MDMEYKILANLPINKPKCHVAHLLNNSTAQLNHTSKLNMELLVCDPSTCKIT